MDQVIEIHDKLVRCPLLDRGKLEGAVGRPTATWGGRPLFESVYEMAAALVHGISEAHAFQDGNKRTAFLAGTHFLALNDVELLMDDDDDDPVTLMLDVANGGIDVPKITEWFIDRS